MSLNSLESLWNINCHPASGVSSDFLPPTYPSRIWEELLFRLLWFGHKEVYSKLNMSVFLGGEDPYQIILDYVIQVWVSQPQWKENKFKTELKAEYLT